MPFLGKRVVDKPITPVVGSFSLWACIHCAHRAVDDEDLVLQKCAQFFSGLADVAKTRAQSLIRRVLQRRRVYESSCCADMGSHPKDVADRKGKVGPVQGIEMKRFDAF